MTDTDGRVVIHSITLTRFKGVEAFRLRLDGQDATVSGDNGAGKTTLADAWSWLLFGKDSRGRTDFAIKTLDATGEPEHGVDHGVEAEVELAGGRQMKLSRVYHEVWAKRRGSAQRVMTGHATDCSIDGVPKTKGEFDVFVAAIADEEAWRVLTDPTYFSEGLAWRDRRRILLKAVGDVTDVQVIDSTRELADLRAVVESGRTIEEHQRVVTAEKKKLNKELERVPVRIDEVRRSFDPGNAVGLEAARDRLEEQRAQQDGLMSHRSEVAVGGRVAELRVEAKRLADERESLRAKAVAARVEATSASEQSVREALTRLRMRESSLGASEQDREEFQRETSRLESRMADRRAEWSEIDDETFSQTSDTVCAACGQNLPEEKVRAAQEEAKALWQERKARRLRELSEDGRSIKKRFDEVSLKLSEAEQTVKAEQKNVEQEKKRLTEARDALKRALDKTANPSEEDERRDEELAVEIAKIDEQIEAEREDSSGALAEVDEQLGEMRAEVGRLEAQVAKAERAIEARDRIAELETEERRLAGEYEEAERQLYLCELFVRTKTSLLEESVNSRFELARFKLFRELVNGGVEECCETTYDGVPFGAGLNDGARTNVGLDIIRTLSEIRGFAPPVWIDHAESTTRLEDVPAQTIRLVVREGVDELSVELED